MNTKINTGKKSKSQQESLDTTDRQELNYEKVEGTPFGVALTKEGFVVTLGNSAMTTPFENKEAAIADAKKIDWNKIIGIIIKSKEL